MTPTLPPSLTGALILGILQGLTEFLPISSSGHLAAAQLLVPGLARPGVTLELAAHVGTTAAVIWYYRQMFRSLATPAATPASLLGINRRYWVLLVAVGSVPTAVIGFAGRDLILAAFDQLQWIAAGLLLTGFVLYASRLRRGDVNALTVKAALLIGTVQGLAILPGVSRSGMTITAALLLGIGHRQAVTYSLLLSIPAVFGAALLDAVQYFAETRGAPLLFSHLLFATLAAGIVGYFCIGLVHRATRTGRWYQFAWYCWLAASVLFLAAR